MKHILIFLFLTIFLSACFDDFPGSDDLERTEVRGTSVRLTNHCQTLTVIEPEEVSKHELPFVLKGFRDECFTLLEAPTDQFANRGLIYYQCILFWDSSKPGDNQQMEMDLDTNAGTPIAQSIINEGDLDFFETPSGDIYRTLFFYLDEQENPHFKWTKNALWPILEPEVDNLKDLQWRFDLQHDNPTLCSEEARWGIANGQIFVDEVAKCYDGVDSRLDSYIFHEDGTIVDITSEASDTNFCSSN